MDKTMAILGVVVITFCVVIGVSGCPNGGTAPRAVPAVNNERMEVLSQQTIVGVIVIVVRDRKTGKEYLINTSSAHSTVTPLAESDK